MEKDVCSIILQKLLFWIPLTSHSRLQSLRVAPLQIISNASRNKVNISSASRSIVKTDQFFHYVIMLLCYEILLVLWEGRFLCNKFDIKVCLISLTLFIFLQRKTRKPRWCLFKMYECTQNGTFVELILPLRWYFSNYLRVPCRINPIP